MAKHETYRLAEDHLVYGKEGKIVKREGISFYDLTAFYPVENITDDYPVQVTVTVQSGYESHAGDYAYEDIDGVIDLVSKITGRGEGESAYLMRGIMEAKHTHLQSDTHKGKYTFIFTIPKGIPLP